MLIRWISWSFILISFFTYAEGENESKKLEVKNEVERIKNNFITIEKEIIFLEEFSQEIAKQKKLVQDFKIEFSNLITLFASDETYDQRFKENKKDLEGLTAEVEKWREQTKITVEKSENLFTILGQTQKSYYENIKTTKGEIRKTYKDLNRKITKFLKSVENNKKKYSRHLKFLISFQKDTEKWKNFIINKLEKSIDRNLFKWSLNPLVINPIQGYEKFKNSFKDAFVKIKKESLKNFFIINKKNIGKRLFLGLLICLFLVFFSKKIISFFKKYFYLQCRESFFFKKSLKIISLFFILFFFLEAPISLYQYEAYPSLLGFFIVVICFVALWFGSFRSLFTLLTKKSKCKKEMNSLIITFLIILSSWFYYFTDSSGVLRVFNNILYVWMAWRCFKILYFIKIKKEEGLFRVFFNFFYTTRVVAVFFTLGIIFSALLQILGWVSLGRSVQNAITNNSSKILIIWFLYQMSIFILNYCKHHVIERKRKEQELIAFLKSIATISFFVFFALLIFESWYSAIFVFSDFWKLALFKIGGYQFTIDIPFKIFILYFSLRLFYWYTTYLLEGFLIEKFNIEKKYSANLTSIVRYFFILLFFSLSLALLGMTYKNLVLLASALGVGIGFGLQNIVNNFISGVILLFEQPVRVGDVIEVDGLISQVKHIGIRSTIVESLENSSIIIPNSDIVSNRLINWTLNNNIMAIKCQVGVAYGTNTDQVTKILSDVAEENNDVLPFPKHVVWFKEFGESSLDFTLKVWINRPRDQHHIHSSLMFAINREFQAEKIKIPFPQRDVHLFEKK